jgi:uncharacterized RDD family membrane protein YckC
VNQESDENAIDTIAVATEPANALVIDALPQVQVAVRSAEGDNSGPSVGLKPDEYPTLATLGEVDLNYRLGGLLLDELVWLPIFALYFAQGMGIVGALLSILYWLSRDAFFGGQSIGKRLVKERVVTLDGSRFTWKHSALRNITFVPGPILRICLLIFLTPVFGMATTAVSNILSLAEIVCVVTTKRRIGDYLAKTKVVYADR